MTASTKIDLAPFQLVDRYELVERLGAGSMAEVWSARRPDSSDHVALKFPRRPAFIRYLRREGVLLQEVKDQHVARVFGAELDHDPPYLVVELVPGQSLRALCRGTIEPKQATLLADQILAGLAAIHRAGIVHLDIKPENVLVQPNGTAKIVDLGLGRAVSAVMAEVYLSASLASREVPLAGTLAYMAPEQRKGKPCDARADLFAFGVLLHELLCGRPPDPATRLSRIRPDLTPRWDVVIAKLTHPDPEQRPRSAEEARHLVSFTLAEKATLPVVEGGIEPRELGTFDDDAFAQAASPWHAGMVVGEHELTEPLGRGGYGEVWKARKGESFAAVKLALREEARAALAVEVAAMKRVEHAGVPRVLEDRTSDETPHVVFELVKGTSLRFLINEEGKIPVADALAIFLEMLEVVRACHAAGVVHRDLKPEHFLVVREPGSSWHVKLIDFGLAALATRQESVEASLGTGAAKGTFDYMAPEQRLGGGDERVDGYALGVCLFEMLADDLPRGPQRLKTLRPEVPDEIDQLALALMAREPSARPPLERAIEDVRDALRPTSRGARPRDRTSRLRLLDAALIALVRRPVEALGELVDQRKLEVGIGAVMIAAGLAVWYVPAFSAYLPFTHHVRNPSACFWCGRDPAVGACPTAPRGRHVRRDAPCTRCGNPIGVFDCPWHKDGGHEVPR